MLIRAGRGWHAVPRDVPAPSGNPFEPFMPLPEPGPNDVGGAPDLAATIPAAVLDRPVMYAISIVGPSTLNIVGGGHLNPIQMPVPERLPRFFTLLGLKSLEHVSAAWATVGLPYDFFPPGQGQIFAIRVPGMSAAKVAAAWRAATRASTDSQQGTFTVGKKDAVVAIVGSGLGMEAAYVSGDVLYLVETMDLWDPDYTHYVGDLIRQLP